MTHTLETLAPGVLAFVSLDVAPSHTNIGVVVAADGMTIIDAGLVPEHAASLVDSLGQISPAPIRRLVLTGSHIDLVGGSVSFPLAAVYGSAQTSDHLDQPINAPVCRALYPAYDFDDVVTRPVTHTVNEPAHLCPASIVVPSGGPQFENLVVQVPAANVVFAGALLTNGVVPLGFEADFPAWADSLATIMGYGEVFVPSHGPIGNGTNVEIMAAYVQACIDAKGSLGLLVDGPWMAWKAAERHLVNVQRAAMLAAGDASPPPSMLALLSA